MTTTRSILFALLAFGLSVGPVGCGDDDETTAGDDEGTSGDEDTGGGTARGIDGPEGSVEPDDRGDEWDGDEPDSDPEPGGSETAEGGSEGGAAEPEEPANPWGATRAEQCRRPERRAMNGAARRAFDQGVQAASSGRVADARRSFQRALSEDRNAYKAAYNLGVLADRSGQANRAMEFYRQALRIQSDYERAVEGMVTIHLRRNAVPDAMALVEPLARANPTNLHLQALYAEVLVRAERYEQAWSAARRALRCDERFVPALIAVVKASLAQGRKELAQSILNQALTIQDNNAELHFIKGSLLRDEPGRFRDSLTEFQRAVQLRPDYAEARMALGVAQLAGGNYNEALQSFQAAANLAPTLVAVHLNLADAYRATKQWQKAKTAFEKALSMESNLPQAHFNMGLMYMSASADFPGLNELQALEKAKEEFTRYRNLRGPRIPRDDPSAQYLEDLDRQISRTRRRMEREERRRQMEAERGAREGEGGEG
ncbi:MAG: tetratricopeptide repeat protein [Myxococcota bacterium]